MKKYLSFILILILFVACDSTNDFGTPFTKGQEVNLTAAIGEQRPQMMPGKQRVSGINAGEEINLKWDEGDKIFIKVGDQSAEFTLSDGADTGKGTFTGIMPADGTSFSVQYPTFLPNLTEQQCVINGFGKDLMLMSTKEAGTLDGGFVLSADYALLGLQLTGDGKIGKIVLSRNNAEGNAGDESYTLLCPNITLTVEPTLFYIVVFPGTWENGFTVEVFASDNSVVIDKFVKTGSITFGTDNAIIMPEKNVQPEPEYVNLGLSVKWATFNVGASKPEDYGDYFAWGETEPKEEYSWATYKWGTSSNMTKYNTTDGKTILDLDDDAAYVNWGGKWRMPSKEEVDELTQHCNWIWTTHNNVNGYKVTGPNGNSIFLPAAGYKGAGPTYPVGEDGLYWTSTLEKGHYSYLIVLHNDAPPTEASTKGTRCFGFTIRPVYDDRPPKRIGVFSVAADKQVSFSQGNLQYTQSTDTWQFAKEQYEYIGAANIKDGALADKIDLFGWSANNTTAPFGVSTSTNAADYAGEFVDWGINTISGDAPGTWRTLSIAEWEYLLEKRPMAASLYGVAQVAGINGMIILPDDWVAPDGITFKTGFHQNDLAFAQHQTFTEQQWLLMETAGAIFLPAAGIVSSNIIRAPMEGGHYQSSDTDSANTNYWIGFRSSYHTIQSSEACTRRSVRLVHDVIP